MKLIGNHAPISMVFSKYLSRFSFLFVLMFFSFSLVAQDGDPKVGVVLFKNNCASCHNKNMKDDLTGPALGGFEERWADYPREDLYSWVRNSQAMISAGHPRAVELWAEWKPTVMNNVVLTDEEIEHVFAYVNAVSAGTFGPKPPVADASGAGVAAKTDNTWIYMGLALVLGLLALILARIVANLDYVTKVKDGNTMVQRRTLVDILTGRGVMGFVLFAAIVFGGYFTVNKAINFGRQMSYAPEQPIKFSHATHAGMQKIDCQYCHDGARRSKHSVIPAANTCMNCHKAVKYGSKYGTAEISKIYASVGYDPSTDKYIDGYEDMSNDEIKKVFTKWISEQHTKNTGKGDVEDVVEEQWDGIVSSLMSGADDNNVGGPIEWVRIHNLPDHVYFNHAQHVTVGKVECQQCHGAVEEMEVVAQHAPLSMGWCINCHRKTEVQFANNEYYDNYYEKYHSEIKAGTRDKVTVEDIGGLGCQKCHY